MNDKTICGADGCGIDYAAIEAEEKLKLWLSGIEPMDYDAPGSTTREMGV